MKENWQQQHNYNEQVQLAVLSQRAVQGCHQPYRVRRDVGTGLGRPGQNSTKWIRLWNIKHHRAGTERARSPQTTYTLLRP